MQIKDIREKWTMLTTKNGQQVRVSADSLPELFLGIDSEGKRGLILWLNDNSRVDYQNCYKERISIEYFAHKKAVLLRLNDNNFFDLFDDLILSVVNHISNVSDNSEYPKELFSTFFKWANFFDDCHNEMLRPNIVQGIWGELFILLQLLLKADSVLLYDDILSSWKGPYRKGHDFETDELDIELKTKEITKQSINISSEYQLEENHSKHLELSVLSVKSDTNNGTSLNDLFINIKEIVQKGNGDLSILLAALGEVKLSPSNIPKYENFKFTALELVTYSCCSDDFPRFVSTNLKPGQFNVKYEILLSEIENFIKNTEKFKEEP